MVQSSKGFNANEVKLIPKNLGKKGFFENFFNYLVKIVFYRNNSCF